MSVVVCTYSASRSDHLAAALQALRRQTRPARQVIVVVDHNPSLLEWVRAREPDVLTIENSEERGLSGARNCGARAAQGEVVVFLDDDAVAEPQCLARLAEAYAEPAVLGTGGAAIASWENRRPAWFPQEFGWVVGCDYRGLPERRSPVRNFIGCCMSFRREALQSVEGFREGLGRVGDRPLGCEETELCIRLGDRFPDGMLLYEPRAAVLHHVPEERGRFGYFCRRCYAEGLSKAGVTRLVGRRRGLASERAYARRVLTGGVASSLRGAMADRDPGALGRAAAIVTGFALTCLGYLVGTARGRR